VIQIPAAVATTVAVWLAWGQLLASKRQAVTQFEDAIAREYREIARCLPTAALLGEPLAADDHSKALGDFLRYIDLTNGQVFPRTSGRISTSTWDDWQQGIRILLTKPAFAKAWNETKLRAPDSFPELRRLEREGFTSDPKRWTNQHLRST